MNGRSRYLNRDQTQCHKSRTCIENLTKRFEESVTHFYCYALNKKQRKQQSAVFNRLRYQYVIQIDIEKKVVSLRDSKKYVMEVSKGDFCNVL